MKIHFIFPPIWECDTPYISIPCLAAYLHKAGHQVTAIDLNIKIQNKILNSEELKRIVEERKLGVFFKKIYGTPMKKEEIVEIICEEGGYQKDEMCFVGDAVTDQKAAQHTDLRFIGRNTDDNKEAFRDLVCKVDNLLQIEEMLEER